MAENDSSLRQTLDIFISQREKKLDEVKRLDLTILQIRQMLGEAGQDSELPNLASFASASIPDAPPAAPAPTGRPPAIRPDEFFGMQYSDAARAYLKRVGHAVALDQLLEALRSGGCKVGGSDPKRVLYISLVRNTRDFVPTGNGHIGLREFYPSLPKGGAAKSQKPKKKVKTKRAKIHAAPKASKPKEKKAAPTESVAEEKVQPVGELQTAVPAVFGPDELLSAKEVIERVEKSLGRSIAPISIHGMLRSKARFESVEGKFRKL